MRNVNRLLVSLLSLLLLAGCGGGSSSGSSSTVASITITAATPSINVGTTDAFSVVAKDSSGNTLSGITFTWASSNTGVATIDSSGLATGVAAGTSNITASSSGITSNVTVLTVQQPASVSGVAAKGVALAGVTVTLVDSAGKTATTTTASDGSYNIGTTGLTPPFLVSVQANANTTFYSVSADANSSSIINVDPLTDLIIRSWYSVQGVSMTAAFANPVSNPPPTPTAVQIISNVVVQVTTLWLQNAGVSTANFSPISTAFAANGAGVDAVLDETTLNTGTGAITITNGTTTQNSTVSYDTGTSSMSVATTTTSPGGSTSSTTGTTVTTSSTQQAALAGITASLQTLAATINSKGSALANTDIISFFDPNLVHDGLNAA